MEAPMSAPLKQFVITENSKAYWRITFGNPPLNLINPETVRELKVLMELIEAQKDLRVVVFDGANPESLLRSVASPMSRNPSSVSPAMRCASAARTRRYGT